MKKYSIILTQKQIDLIGWAVYAGLDQYRKHLMHDDWDLDKDKKQVNITLKNERNLILAGSILSKAIDKAKKGL